MKNLKTSQISIGADGTITAIYSDDLADLFAEGHVHIQRASHVEPEPDGTWSADLAPIGGPKLTGFRLRQDALDAEIAFLEAYLFGGPN